MSPWVRKRRERRLKKFIPIVACVAICAVSVIVRSRRDQPLTPDYPATAAQSIPPDRVPAVDIRERRQIYPYSVVRGGVADRYELAAAMAGDAVVAAHYAGFDVSQARSLRLERELSAHVSYRIRNRVFWTSKKIPVRASELVITDGRELARARCGNRIALDAQVPTSPEEPAAEIFDLPEGPEPQPEPFVGTPLQAYDIPVLPPERFLDYPVIPSPVWPRTPPPVFPPPRIHPPPPAAIPEPGTLVLLASGLVALLAWRRRHK